HLPVLRRHRHLHLEARVFRQGADHRGHLDGLRPGPEHGHAPDRRHWPIPLRSVGKPRRPPKNRAKKAAPAATAARTAKLSIRPAPMARTAPTAITALRP